MGVVLLSGGRIYSCPLIYTTMDIIFGVLSSGIEYGQKLEPFRAIICKVQNLMIHK